MTPELESGRSYLRDIFSMLYDFCPPGLHPKRVGDTLIFKNPTNWNGDNGYSMIEHRGWKNSQGESLRGGRANIIVVDEAREIANLRYFVENILAYQFDRQFLPLLVLSTTPPKSMAHEWASWYVPLAKKRGTYIICPAEDTDEAEGNDDFSEEDAEKILEITGEARDSIAWKREALCKLISDPKSLIIPEFRDVKDKIIFKREPPPYFNAYEGVDFGFQDHNGVVLGFIDFLKGQFHIQGEVWGANLSTGQLARAILELERRLWAAPGNARSRSMDADGQWWSYKSLLRVGDHEQQQLHDLALDHRLFIAPADKWDFDASLASLRHSIANEKITIDPDCVNLIHQAEHGTWKESADGERKTFTRSAVLGHCDLLAALNYCHRHLNWQANPYPPRQAGAEEIWIDGAAPASTIVAQPLSLKFRPLR